MSQARLLKLYQDKVFQDLKEELKLKNPMEVPRIEKVVVSMGLGDAVKEGDRKLIEGAKADIKAITGQAPLVTKARKAIADFGIKKGMQIGLKVTLRGKRMYEFLDRFINVVLPRTRDFQGLPLKSFDGNGNYNLGLDEQIVFPEIDYDKITSVRGLNISIKTTTSSDDQAALLLEKLGVPLRDLES